MKARVFTILIILAIGLAGFTQRAQAQAYTTSFTTGITYQNVGTAATTTLQFLFYPTADTVTPITITQPSLAAGAGTSLFIGSLSEINPGFRGSAVLQSDQPLLATLVQVPAAGAVKNRPISNGFSGGGPVSLIATVLKNYQITNSIFSVMNVDSQANNINIKFFDTSANLVHTFDTTTPVQPGASIYWDTGAAGDPLPTTFSGSAVVTATRVGGGDGAIVTSAMELEITGVGAKAFEGVAQGATTFFMPSALCNYNIGGGHLTNSAYAIQNSNLTTSTDITVAYTDGTNTYSQTQTVGPGAKGVFLACASGAPNGFVGAATVTSSATDVIAVGKIYGSGMSTGYVGAAAGSGTAKVALPYVRWATTADYAAGTFQRVYITIQNIGTSAISGDVVVTYNNCTGGTDGTHTITGGIAVGAKKVSNASLAGLTEFGRCGAGYGGSVLITAPAGSQLAVVARVQTQDTTLGLTVAEDYNGLNAP